MENCVNHDCDMFNPECDYNCGMSNEGMQVCEAYIKAQTTPVANFQCSAGLGCPTMEECGEVNNLVGDKDVLAAGLREIYNIRGEDKDIAKIVNEALQQGCAT